MKLLAKTSLIGLLALLLGGWGADGVLAASATGTKNQDQTAIQAMQQALDPSAVLEAYANGLAVDRHNPQFYAAFVGRMVALRMPELAYHQAQTLVKLDPNNGLGWGVLAYGDAKRGDVARAIPAITQAARLAPDNKFVARISGEILAWYDVKADKSQLTAQDKADLAQTRALVGKDAPFTTAYTTMKQLYQLPASVAQQVEQLASNPNLYAASSPVLPYYYNNNYYYPYYNNSPYYTPYNDYYPYYNNYYPWGPYGYGYSFYPGYLYNNPEFFEGEEPFEHHEFGEFGGGPEQHEFFEHHPFGEEGGFPEQHEFFEHQPFDGGEAFGHGGVAQNHSFAASHAFAGGFHGGDRR